MSVHFDVMQLCIVMRLGGYVVTCLRIVSRLHGYMAKHIVTRLRGYMDAYYIVCNF